MPESPETNEPEKPGIGFGDRRANLVGLAILGLMLVGFLVGLIALLVVILK